MSESELTGAGINVGSIINQDNVDIGGYKSGMTYCAFGSVSDDNYQKFLENNKIDPRLSSVNGIKRIYSDLITKEGTGLDGMPAQQDMLLRAASAILDHADRLAIQVEGYDPTSGYGYGYTTRLYLMTDGRPKEIEKYDTGGVLFADRLSEEMAICPQLRIVQFLNDALADEVSRIKDMKDRGIEVTNLDRDGKLYTLLNALDNTNNNGNGW